MNRTTISWSCWSESHTIIRWAFHECDKPLYQSNKGLPSIDLQVSLRPKLKMQDQCTRTLHKEIRITGRSCTGTFQRRAQSALLFCSLRDKYGHGEHPKSKSTLTTADSIPLTLFTPALRLRNRAVQDHRRLHIGCTSLS